MNQIAIFNFDENHVRILTDKQGSPWWIAGDVCKILGLTNSREAVQRLDDDEKIPSESLTVPPITRIKPSLANRASIL